MGVPLGQEQGQLYHGQVFFKYLHFLFFFGIGVSFSLLLGVFFGRTERYHCDRVLPTRAGHIARASAYEGGAEGSARLITDRGVL